MINDVIIDVPSNAKISVTVGMIISLKTKLFLISDTDDIIVPITKPLKTKAEDVFKLVDHVIGDKIVIDEVLAQKKGLVGVRKILSPVSGVLKSINHETGEIVITVEKSTTNEFLSPIEGKISNIDQKNKIISISVSIADQVDVEFVTELIGGEISFVESSISGIDLTNVRDKIVVIEEITPTIASKFEALDALAFIYLNGSHNAKIAHAKVTSNHEFDKLKKTKDKMAVLLPKRKKIVVY